MRIDFRKMASLLLASFLLVALTQQSFSADRYIKTVEGEFEDVMFDLQDAIVNEGLVIERTGDIGEMLERTADAVEGAKTGVDKTFANAKYLLFCSARLTHKATALDPRNISMCPFIVFAYDNPKDAGKVSVGYRNPDFGNLPASDSIVVEVHAYLKTMIDTATEGY